MTLPTMIENDAESPATERLRRFTVDEVLKMVDCGVIGEDEPVELLDGALLVREPQGPYHGGSLQALWQRLNDLVRPAGAHARGQLPLLTEAESLPEPDVAIVRGEARDYLERHPRGSDAFLVVELALSSQAYDARKAERYARGAVPVYWLVDLIAGTIAVHERPDAAAGRYRAVRTIGRTDTLRVPVPGVDATIPVTDVLGER